MGWLVLPAISFLLLAAHFLRDGHWPMMLLALGCMGLLAVPRPWAAHLIMVALFAAALVWLYSLVSMAMMRWTMDLPFLRLSVILSAVILLTVGSICVLTDRRLQSFYGLGSRGSDR
ncbi:hypothetical protein [Wenzhouxiangella limi]|uniref:Uncharacterized protein n=1 Tax=Wenzhouxiangella limi TaxID=2707351 RepID=A0A845V1U0_9GAMM|nr:hypothetical protein [Wenzhouxiangella limi]NDY96210.1 hypothetical protein [Wenzhouxiangella limi]